MFLARPVVESPCWLQACLTRLGVCHNSTAEQCLKYVPHLATVTVETFQWKTWCKMSKCDACMRTTQGLFGAGAGECRGTGGACKPRARGNVRWTALFPIVAEAQGPHFPFLNGDSPLPRFKLVAPLFCFCPLPLPILDLLLYLGKNEQRQEERLKPRKANWSLFLSNSHKRLQLGQRFLLFVLPISYILCNYELKLLQITLLLKYVFT